MLRKIFIGVTLSLSQLAFAESAPQEVQLDDINVFSTTPLHGVGLSKEQIPYPVQTISQNDLQRGQSTDISDYMQRHLSSVTVNNAQNNPLQPDVQYRGFSASPLLGNSQGVSVYMNGVRVNEPFADVVNWDIFPQAAVADMNLIAGSNPVFGLNTLGGALSIKTKNGFTHDEESVTLIGGSFGRFQGGIESGGNDGEWSYYVHANRFEEDGWRDFSPSEANQFFGSLGWQSGDSELELIAVAADSDLNGNGSSPKELMDIDREAVFTHPDNTQNELGLLSLTGSHWLNDETQLSVSSYYRQSDRDTFNGDGSDYGVIDSIVGGDGLNEDGDIIITAAECGGGCSIGDLVEEGEQVEDQNDNPINPGLDDDEIAVNNTSQTEQESMGLQGQVALLGDLMGHENQLIVGASFDYADIDYAFSTEIAEFTATRGTEGTGLLDSESVVDAEVETYNGSVFFSNNMAVTDALNVNVSGRYNYSRVKISGTSGETSVVPAGESGKHTWTRFNPAAGLTYKLNPNRSMYINYSEASRVPTPAELTCHDPANPCALPNSFLSDPPLDLVVAKTWEAGLRGQTNQINWHLGVFRTTSNHDIYFVPTEEGPGLSPGFFDDIGKTRRQGVELALSADYQTWDWFANYSYLNAEFRSEFEVNSENHPIAAAGGDEEFTVQKGDRIPSLPEHTFKFGANWKINEKATVGFDTVFNGSQHFRGDEANEADKVASFTVTNLHGRYQVTPDVEVFARVDNLFDEDYENFGLYGEPDEAPGFDTFSDTRFYGAGAPRAGWVGVKATF